VQSICNENPSTQPAIPYISIHRTTNELSNYYYYHYYYYHHYYYYYY